MSENENRDTLKFKVAPHIVEDLGLNLYTTLARVLVEFIANAYDADANCATVKYDPTAIRDARRELKRQFEIEKLQRSGTSGFLAPLETRVLPSEISIEIRDNGHGMSTEEVDKKFLFAGRRRRREEPEANGRSPSGRPLMGRKGLGKLAGFGVAKRIQLTTRRHGEAHATYIELKYDDLVTKSNVHEIDVPFRRLDDGGGIQDAGTRIVLSELLYDPLKSRGDTIERQIAGHFSQIDPSEFAVLVNDAQVPQATRTLVYAWPNPDEPVDQFVDHTLEREGGGVLSFKYRLRFTGKNEALEASQRGVRVYAHKRLAAAPSLLGADTNMHGFRMTDYLDGVVHADFIDEEEADYIATDRESLRWESPLLAGLYEFLSGEIKEACKQYQKSRDEQSPDIVKSDAFTLEEIAKHDFSARDRRLAFRFAQILEGACKRGVDDPAYKNTFPPLVQGIGHGNILTAISALADQEFPDLKQIVHELVRLSKDECDQFLASVRARLKGISALKKIIERPDFRASRNEKDIQKLFESCPWLVDPTYTQFLLSADVSLNTLFSRLAQELGIGSFASDPLDRKEPDLVFLIGNESLRRVVIVELKASNVALDSNHLQQLEYYMERASEWLNEQNFGGFKVLGHLIGTKPSPNSRAEGAVVLRKRIKESGPETSWRVRDFLEVLSDSESAHNELVEIRKSMDSGDDLST